MHIFSFIPKDSDSWKSLFPKFQIVFVFIIIFLPQIAFGQNFLIKGKVVNSKNGKPIEFATVSVLGQSLGVVTNDLGEFSFSVPEKFREGIICVSCLGYKTYQENAKMILENPSLLHINLAPNYFKLEEVYVLAQRKSINPDEIVAKAIEAISQNYPDTTFMLKAYYRDYLKDQGKYMNLLEAACTIEDKGFGAKDFESTKFRLQQVRYDDSYNYDVTKSVKYDNKIGKFIPGAFLNSFGGNEFSILRAHDPIRNADRFSFSFINCLKKDFIANHIFTVDSVTVLNDEYIYCIGFVQAEEQEPFVNFSAFISGKSIIKNKRKQKYQVSGKIYISADSYSILKILYTNNYKESRKGKMYELILEYKEFQGKMYLNYLSFSNYFEMRDYSDDYFFRVEDAVLKDETNQLVIKFNNSVDVRSAVKKRSYHVRYKDKKVPVEDLWLESPNVVILQLDKSTKITNNNDFSLTVGKLYDVKGNKLDQLKTIPMYQFRELFVNEVLVKDFESIPYQFSSSKTIPLYIQRKSGDPSFWKGYNYVRNKPLQK